VILPSLLSFLHATYSPHYQPPLKFAIAYGHHQTATRGRRGRDEGEEGQIWAAELQFMFDDSHMNFFSFPPHPLIHFPQTTMRT